MYKGRVCRIPFSSEFQGNSPAFLKYISIKILSLGLYLSVCKGRVHKVHSNKSYRSLEVGKQCLKIEMDNFGCYPKLPTKAGKMCSFKQALIRNITIRQHLYSDLKVNCDYCVN
jgi:hypothetical protein